MGKGWVGGGAVTRCGLELPPVAASGPHPVRCSGCGLGAARRGTWARALRFWVQPSE